MVSSRRHDAPLPSPLPPAYEQTLPVLRAAYSDRTAALMARFSELAYVPFPTDIDAKIDDPGSLGALLAPGGFAVLHRFEWGSVQAFLAIRPGVHAVLAFRGTANPANWWTDFDLSRIAFPDYPQVQIHKGFYETFEAARRQMEAALAAVPPDVRLYITGHSLGGALAQIASAVFARDNLAACYTFGSPRVANKRFDIYVKCPHYRVINHWDIVPGIPLASPWGYQHGGDPRLLTGKRPEAILRDDYPAALRFFVDLAGFVPAVIQSKTGIVNDHRISNYRRQLDHIARARGHAQKPQPAPPALQGFELR